MSSSSSDDKNDDAELAESEEEDLGDLLASMDIDKDFNMWSSFRQSEFVSPRNSSASSTPMSSPAAQASELLLAEEEEDIRYWWQRLQRDEVYSHRYSPTEPEKQELQDVESLLGMNVKIRLPGFMRRKSDDSLETKRVSWNQLVHPEENGSNADRLPASILLKRGPALWEEEEYELILLTQGLVLAKVVAVASTFEKKLVPRTFHRAILWSDVEYVSLDSSDETTAWEMQLSEDDEPFIFVCASPRQCQAWVDAMEKCLVHYHMHSKASSRTGELGWQYKLVGKPGYTVAVTDKVDTTARQESVSPDEWNSLDEYNGYAPLHYAVRTNHVNAMQYLLDVGADPNVKDAEGRTPMYYAVRDELPRMTVTLLESYGAEKSELAKAETKGELFGRVAATEAVVEERRREDEQKRQAEAAAAEMAENMRLLQQRGEKIEEMDDKARQMNEGAQNFAEMAAQLKEKSKGGGGNDKKWWNVL